MGILDKINSPDDVKALGMDELTALCDELRSFLITNVSKTGGHLASNLGVVELTVAIHSVFNTESDRLVFDVGHQSYVHKILTGRKNRFRTLRQFGGLAGFPKPGESQHDAFIAGHASNSISVALGMARARTLSRKNYSVLALIGDGALTGGLAYEALCDAGESCEPLVIILNDNGMSIRPNVGGMAHHLAKQRLKPSYASFKKRYRRLMDKLPGGRRFYRITHSIKTAIKDAILHCSMFEDMGLQYVGPVDGHNLERLIEALQWAKDLREPVLVHVITTKGKGYKFSEENPDLYHGVSRFDPNTGIIPDGTQTFSGAFGEDMLRLAENDMRVCAITAAMASGTGLVKFSEKFPERFFDVGIAEEHGAAMAAGLASQGMIPVFAVYSTFLQRSYDMLLHDVAISAHHVVFAVDRAGLVGDDGETHHGIFDVGYLTSVPNMTVLCPASFAELRAMLEIAAFKLEGPVAVRYPRGGEGEYRSGGVAPSKRIREGTDCTIVAYGTMINTALEVSEKLVGRNVQAEIIKLDFIYPIDFKAIIKSVRKTKRLVVIEECVHQGSIGQKISEKLFKDGIELKYLLIRNLGDRFIPHGSTQILRRMCGIDADSIYNTLTEEIFYE